MKLSKENISTLDKREKVLFINSLSGFKSANLVGTANKQKQTNLAIVSSVVHLGANPPLLSMIMRPHTVPRGTLENILQTGVYTLNHVNTEIFEQAHQSSARYADDLSEFDEVGLTAQWEEGFNAPFVKECHIKIGMEFRERHTLEINGTELIIGEIVSIEVPDEIVANDGFISLESAGTVAVSSLDTYHSTQTLASLSYAKPEEKAVILSRDAVSNVNHVKHVKHVNYDSHDSHDSSSIVDTREMLNENPKCVLVVGASGGIGQAYCENLLFQFPDIQLIRVVRDVQALKQFTGNCIDIEADLSDDDSIQDAISTITEKYNSNTNTRIDWLFIASGWLHDEAIKPEKTFRSLHREHLLHSYNINAVGPALFVSRLLELIDKQQALTIGILSARVGSVSDNRLGGWHSYRAGKSALHMLIKNIAIECAQTRRPITIVGLQPGTTDTALSEPFQKGLTAEQLQTPEFTAKHLIKVMQVLKPEDSGQLFDFEGILFAP